MERSYNGVKYNETEDGKFTVEWFWFCNDAPTVHTFWTLKAVHIFIDKCYSPESYKRLMDWKRSH